MIQARRRLLGELRGFFEQHLPEVSWDEVRHHTPEEAPRVEHNRRNPIGKHLERATVGFDAYELTIESSEQAPPLGQISIRCVSSGQGFSGVIDQTTWVKVAQFIKGNDNGR